MAADIAEKLRRLAEAERTAPPANRYSDVGITCRVCGEAKNPLKQEIYEGSAICYQCSAKRIRQREILQYTIPGAVAFTAAIYTAHDVDVCRSDSLPGCALFTSTVVAAFVFFVVYAMLAD